MLCDAGPIASLFWQNEEFAMGLGSDIHLDGVVCVVDAVFGDQVSDLVSDRIRLFLMWRTSNSKCMKTIPRTESESVCGKPRSLSVCSEEVNSKLKADRVC